MKYLAYTSSSSPSLLRKAAALVITAGVAAAMLMFSAVVLVVLLVLGAIVAAWVWWKTRELRKVMKQFQAQAANESAMFGAEAFREKGSGGDSARGEIIEGEAVRVHEPRDGAPR